MSKNYANFGSLSSSYVKARKGYGPEVINYCNSLIPKNALVILDLGCGTGISTREISTDDRLTIGQDPDIQMIEKAIAENAPNTSYICASAENIPFQDNLFDAVITFSAYHWFQNNEAAKEIKRVLKSAGVFIIVQNQDDSEFRQTFRQIIAQFSDKPIPDQSEDYGTPASLKAEGFNSITQKNFTNPDEYTLEGLIEWIHSISLWGLVPKEKEEACDNALRTEFESHLTHGKFIRNKAVLVFSARP